VSDIKLLLLSSLGKLFRWKRPVEGGFGPPSGAGPPPPL